MNVVFDTNVLVSAIGWDGPPRQAFFRCLNDPEAFTILVSEPLLDELARVLDYPKISHHVSDEQKYIIVSSLVKAARLVDPDQTLDVVSADPHDNRVLECALAGDADYIVSGDNHLLKLRSFEQAKIVTPEGFLSGIDPTQST